MKNVTKLQTILFATLIAVMILPFNSESGIQSAEAAKEPYTLAEIDKAFTNSKGYVTYDSEGNMVVDKKQMRKDSVSRDDIKIMKQWAKLNNKITEVIKTGDQTDIDNVMTKAQSGKFSLLTNATTTTPQGGASGQTSVWFWSLNACGITYGQTSHLNPSKTVNKDGFDDLQSIQNSLVASGYHQIQHPWADRDSVGYDYGKKNLTGVGGCNEGEFRDENFIYSNTTTHHYGSVISNGWHTLQQLNEPNPELDTYDSPTFWWDVYTALWHYTN